MLCVLRQLPPALLELWAECLCKAACAIVNYAPYQDKCLSTTWKKQLVNRDIFIENALYYVLEWMKAICHTWSRSRQFSPYLPGDRYLNIGSKSDTTGPKSRGTSLRTKLWRHVQRYCAKFLSLMQINGYGYFFKPKHQFLSFLLFLLLLFFRRPYFSKSFACIFIVFPKGGWKLPFVRLHYDRGYIINENKNKQNHDPKTKKKILPLLEYLVFFRAFFWEQL